MTKTASPKPFKPVTVTLDEPLLIAVRRLNGKINGSLGGQTKSRNQTLARRRNMKVAKSQKAA